MWPWIVWSPWCAAFFYSAAVEGEEILPMLTAMTSAARVSAQVQHLETRHTLNMGF